MNLQKHYRRLMKQILEAHEEFAKAWSQARSAELSDISGNKRHTTWKEVWTANGVAYQSTQSLSEQINRLLLTLFNEANWPTQTEFLAGNPSAIQNVIDFLTVDVPAYRCGYVKEDILCKLKSIDLSGKDKERLREYTLSLCRLPAHRREIRQAGRLMIRIADQDFVTHVRMLTADANLRVAKKSLKMLAVVLNGRKDLK